MNYTNDMHEKENYTRADFYKMQLNGVAPQTLFQLQRKQMHKKSKQLNPTIILSQKEKKDLEKTIQSALNDLFKTFP